LYAPPMKLRNHGETTCACGQTHLIQHGPDEWVWRYDSYRDGNIYCSLLQAGTARGDQGHGQCSCGTFVGFDEQGPYTYTPPTPEEVLALLEARPQLFAMTEGGEAHCIASGSVL